MARYRAIARKVIDAEQFTSEEAPPRGVFRDANGVHVVRTMQGVAVDVRVGEWIVKESSGVGYYPIDDAEFRRTYEPAPEREPDFGVSRVEHEGVVLGCKFIAPGITMSDLMTAFHKAEEACGPNDFLSANPSEWPGTRGIRAVTEMILTAVYGPNDAASGSKQK